MHDLSRREAFRAWSGLGASLIVPSAVANAAIPPAANPFDNLASEAGVIRARLLLREATYEALFEELTKDAFEDYFSSLDVEHFDGTLLTTSVTSRFSRNWITQWYLGGLLAGARSINPAVDNVVVALRQHRTQRPRSLEYRRSSAGGISE